MLGFLPAYMTEENLSSGSGFWLLDVIGRTVPLPVMAYLAVAATIMAGLAVGALRRPADPRASLPWATALGTAAMLFASPHYAWYFVWLVALLVRRPVVAGILADAYRGPALLGAGDRAYSALGGVHDLRRVCHIGLRRHRLEICRCCEVRRTAWPPPRELSPIRAATSRPSARSADRSPSRSRSASISRRPIAAICCARPARAPLRISSRRPI